MPVPLGGGAADVVALAEWLAIGGTWTAIGAVVDAVAVVVVWTGVVVVVVVVAG